jgi:flagellar protein FlaG
MSLEISGVSATTMMDTRMHSTPIVGTEFNRRPHSAAPSHPVQNSPNIEQVVAELEQITTAMNRRLKFSVNKDLGQVIVKVIDRNTDKVIKELPPEELQRLHIRLREAIGLLVDEQI